MYTSTVPKPIRYLNFERVLKEARGGPICVKVFYYYSGCCPEFWMWYMHTPLAQLTGVPYAQECICPDPKNEHLVEDCHWEFGKHGWDVSKTFWMTEAQYQDESMWELNESTVLEKQDFYMIPEGWSIRRV